MFSHTILYIFDFLSFVPRAYSHDAAIIANVEIDSPSGENVEWHGVGVSLCRAKNIALSRKPQFVYRYDAPNSHEKGVSCALRVGGR